MLFNLFFPLWYVVTRLISFGTAADAQIAQLSALFAVRLQIFLLLVRVLYGLDPYIASGRRTAAQQDALHRADDRNPPARTGSSHMAGNAADLNFLHGRVNVLMKGTAAAKWEPIYALAAACGIKNGSTFPGYPDNDHFYI